MVFDPFEGKDVKPFGGPSAPSTPSPRVAALAEEAEALDAMGRAHRCWVYPLIGLGIMLFYRLVFIRVFVPPPVAWVWMFAGVVLLFQLGGLWRFFGACWNLRKYRRRGFLWPISLGLIVNIPTGMFVVAMMGTLVGNLWYRLTQLFHG